MWTHIFRPLWSAAIGVPLSLAIAIAGPLIFPTQPTTTFDANGTHRSTCWLFTIHHSGNYSYTTPAHEVAELVRTAPVAAPLSPIPTYLMSHACSVLESGFPLRSFMAWSLVDSPCFGPCRSENSGFAALQPAGDNPISAGWIVHQPLWPGVATNAVFWSAVIYPLLLITAALRRRLRIHRQLCPACTYPRIGLAPSAPCPECGHTLTPAAAGSAT